MKLQSEFIKEHYPSAAKTSPPPDFVRIAYLEYVVDELILHILKPYAPNLVAMAQADEPPVEHEKVAVDLVLEDGTKTGYKLNLLKRCTCETFGGGALDWTCPVCGGGRF